MLSTSGRCRKIDYIDYGAVQQCIISSQFKFSQGRYVAFLSMNVLTKFNINNIAIIYSTQKRYYCDITFVYLQKI